MKIINYSQYIKESNSTNISNIIDKMIRLTAKLTESYASDIIYDIEALNNVVKNHKSYDCILFFREYGVTTRTVEELTDDVYDNLLCNFTPIQTWRLTHNPLETKTILIRVDLLKEKLI